MAKQKITPIQINNPVKFSAYRAAAANTGNGAFGLITFDTKLFDTSSNYSTSSGLFTAPVTAYYGFNSTVGVSNNTGSVALAFFKNGAELKRFTQISISSGRTFGSGSLYLQLTAGDTIGVYAFGSSALALDLTGGQLGISFDGSLTSAT